MKRSATPQPAGAVTRRPSTLRSIRAYCLWCAAGQPGEVRQCPAQGCSLWPYRFGHNPRYTSTGSAAELQVPEGMTARRAVGLRCTDCHEFLPRTCPCPECPLYPIRPKGRVRSANGTRERISGALAQTRPDTPGIWDDIQQAPQMALSGAHDRPYTDNLPRHTQESH
jgi:hypothetical protein